MYVCVIDGSNHRVRKRVNNRVSDRVSIFFAKHTKPDRGTGQEKDNPCPVGAQKNI